MADNCVRTPGTGETILADEVTDATLGTGKVQMVKIMDGTLDGTDKCHVDATNGLAVEVKNSSIAGTAGTANAGVLSVQGIASMTPVQVSQATAATLNCTEASAAAIKTAVEIIDDAIYVDDADWTDSTSKHILVGGLYQTTPQTVTDGDVAPFQTDASGRQIVNNLFTVANCIQWSHYSNEYTTTQTSTDLVALSGSTKFYIGRLTIGTGGTTAGLVTVYLGTGAYVAGTDQVVFRGNFAPSATAYPGVVIGNGAAPFIISAAGDALKITTSAGITVYVQVDYIRV